MVILRDGFGSGPGQFRHSGLRPYYDYVRSVLCPASSFLGRYLSGAVAQFRFVECEPYGFVRVELTETGPSGAVRSLRSHQPNG